jgi:hypothetical protein
MERIEIDLLCRAISKFKTEEFDEDQFQSSFNSVINMITEHHNFEIRRIFESIDCELERIIFLSNNKRKEFLREIDKIENILKENKLICPQK